MIYNCQLQKGPSPIHVVFGNNIDICVIINRAQYVSLPPVLTLCLHLLTLKFVRIYTDCWILSVFRGDLYVGVAAAEFTEHPSPGISPQSLRKSAKDSCALYLHVKHRVKL